MTKLFPGKPSVAATVQGEDRKGPAVTLSPENPAGGQNGMSDPGVWEASA